MTLISLFSLLLTSAAAAKIPLQPAVVPGLPSINQLIEGYGLPCTNILVTTEDGYAIWLHRMGNNTGPPIIVQHGFLNAADLWLTRGSWDQDLVYLLVKQGYDVYLSNVRGNVYNPYHVKYRRSDPRYWDFSIHELGYYDLPAMIDRILKMRGTKQLFYIGHSLGTTIFLIMASTRPEYNSKIKTAILMAPVAFTPDPSEFSISFVRLAIQKRHQLWRALKSNEIVELLPRTPSMIKAVQDFCKYKAPTQDYCLDLIGLYLGEHRANINRKTLANEIMFSPAGTSCKLLYHLSQIYETSNFEYLSYGPKENLLRYNSTKPPSYPLEKVTSPVALIWSYNDNLLSERSVKRLKSALPNVIRAEPIRDPKFTHADYFLGINAKEMVYYDVIDILKRYRQ